MVQFEVSINKKARVAYIPKVIVESLGNKVTIVPNTKAAVIFGHDAQPKDVLRSLRQLEDHFKDLAGENK